MKAVKQSARGRVTIVDELFNHIGHVTHSVATGNEIDLRITSHRALERLLVEHYRVASPVVTVPVGIDVPANGVGRARTPRSRPIVGWIGRLSVEKRPEWFVRLAAELGDLAIFRLAGEGPRKKEVHRAGLDIPSLELLGFVDDAIAFIADCDLLVLTSEIEGIPLVAMEAVSCGTPVVATDVGGLAALIEPGVNGYLVPADDPDALILSVRQLLEEPLKLQRLQNSVAAAGLADEFKSSTMVDRFRDLLV